MANTAVATHVSEPALRGAYNVGRSVLGSIRLLFASTLQIPPSLPWCDSNSATPEAPALDSMIAFPPVTMVPSFGESSDIGDKTLPSFCLVPAIANPPSALSRLRPVFTQCRRTCQLGASSVGGISQVLTSTSFHGCIVEYKTGPSLSSSCASSTSLRIFHISPPSSLSASALSGTNCSRV